MVQVKNREGLINYLRENNVETKIHYPIPIHLQKPCQEFGYKKGDFPVCEKQAQKILSSWSDMLGRFVKVIPIDYRKSLEKIRAAEERYTETTPATEEVFYG